MNDSKKLSQLQEIDLELVSKRETLANVQSKIGDQWLAQMEKAQRSAEAESEDTGAKRREVEAELYNGKVTNIKELGSLQEEFEQIKSKLKQVDDRVLEVMGEVDVANKSLISQEQKLKDVETQWRLEQDSLAGESSILQAAITQLDKKRGTLAAEITPASLKVYEELRNIMQGKVVAKMEQGKCRGCRLSLSVHELKRVRSPNMVQCSSCHRILYMD
ncbi:MAG: hypothetical protein HW399_911 [Dehalococcoidia bacterium]|nr:hypothetical protein [Dehalococcoidia bacterium]